MYHHCIYIYVSPVPAKQPPNETHSRMVDISYTMDEFYPKNSGCRINLFLCEEEDKNAKNVTYNDQKHGMHPHDDPGRDMG